MAGVRAVGTGLREPRYGILSAQLLLTIVVAYPCATMSDQLLEKYSWLPALWMPELLSTLFQPKAGSRVLKLRSLFTMLAFVLVISCTPACKSEG